MPKNKFNPQEERPSLMRMALAHEENYTYWLKEGVVRRAVYYMFHCERYLALAAGLSCTEAIKTADQVMLGGDYADEYITYRDSTGAI